MEINIPTGQDILRDIAIQYVNKAFVYITSNFKKGETGGRRKD